VTDGKTGSCKLVKNEGRGYDCAVTSDREQVKKQAAKLSATSKMPAKNRKEPVSNAPSELPSKLNPAGSGLMNKHGTVDRPVIFISLLLVGATLAVYWPVKNFDFINFDDHDYVTENYHVLSGLTWRGLPWALTTIYTGNWHPLTWLSHMTDCQLFGTWAGGHHLANVFFHAANTVLLFLTLNKLTGKIWRGAFVAALFALHPLHVESVAWISERKDVLSTFFGLLCLFFYACYVKEAGGQRQKKRFYYGSALFCFVLGLMSKPMLVTWPFVMLLLDYWPLGRFAMTPKEGKDTIGKFSVRFLLWEKAPFLGLSILSCLVTFMAQRAGGAVQSLSGLPLSVRLENALVSYARYSGKAFWPVNLANPYPHPGAWPMWEVLPAAALLAGVCVIVVWLRRTRPYLFVGWFWFLGMLIPVIGLVQVGTQAMADRYTYMPLVGIFIMLTWGAGESLAGQFFGKPVCAIASVVFLLACAFRTEDQIGYWRNSRTLSSHAIAVTKGNDTAYSNLGNYYLEHEQYDKAIDNYRKALQFMGDGNVTNDIMVTIAATNQTSESGGTTYLIGPQKILSGAEIFNNLGTALDSKGHATEALQYFNAAIQLNPDQAHALYNLGCELVGQKKYQQAIESYEAAIRLRPDLPEMHNALGNALVAIGKGDDAIEQYNVALQLSPNDAMTHNYLGLALAGQGHPAEAIKQYEAALQLDPKMIEVHNNLGSALISVGDIDEAIRHFRLLLQWMPDHARAHDNLGIALASKGELDEAVTQFREAIRLDPENADTHFNLGNVLALQQRFDEAEREYEETLRLAPNLVQAHCNLGAVLNDLGRKDDAIAQLREALHLNPDYTPAKEQLQKMGIAVSP
jgi:tetratricopeptide (TPR) repeat protein